MIVYSNAHATELVKAGVQWANTHYGTDWVWRIDPNRLDIGNGVDCFLGQMHAIDAAAAGDDSGWRYAVATGIISWDRAYDLGLSVPYACGHGPEWETNVRTINAAWRAQIGQLRKTVPAPVA